MRRNAMSLLAALLWTAAVGSEPRAAAQTTALLSFTQPASAAAGSGGLTMAVYGAGFTSGSYVLWNGLVLTTTYVSAGQLNAQVPANLLATPGTATIRAVVIGSAVTNSLTFTITSAPVSITTTTLPKAVVGTTYTAFLQATGGTQPYSWSVIGGALPAGITLGSGGLLTGVPTVIGTYSVTVRVTDQLQGSAVQAFQLVVNNPALNIQTPTTLPPATATQAYNQMLTASGGVPPLKWSVTGNFPAGLNLDTTTGAISGKPDTAGTYAFTVRVTDSAGTSATASFSLLVNPGPLVITTGTLFSATVGIAYSQTFNASGGVPPYTWSISGGTGALVLDPSMGVLSGTPQSTGTYTFTVKVADSAGATASQNFTLAVEAPKLTILNAATLPAGTVGTAYLLRFTVLGGTAPYTYAIGGYVPGLAFDSSTATLYQTPTQAGTYTLILQVHDSQGASVTKTFTLVINAGPLTLTGATQLSDGTVTVPWTHTLTASGGAPPYSWSANGLPDGLQLDTASGVISGTPTKPGTFAFTVRVSDSNRASAADLYRVTIGLPALPEISVTGLTATVAAATQPAIGLRLSGASTLPLSGRLVLSFAPDSGPGDDAIQFSTGGRSVSFTVDAGSSTVNLPVSRLAFQSGTVAGTIKLTVQLLALDADVTPNPAPSFTTRVERAAPVLSSAKVVRSGSGLSIQVTGYSTAREVTQAVFRFKASPGNSLQTADFTISLEDAFNKWFQDPATARYGSQFVYTLPFTVQGDVNAVLPDSVTFTNRLGSATIQVTQ